MTDFMAFFVHVFKPYRVVSAKLASAIQDSGVSDIIDLCSGAGLSTVMALQDLLSKGSREYRLTLTDKYPNVAAFRTLSKKHGGTVNSVESPVDATNVPEDLKGFRTLFGSFHHFDVEKSRDILTDAVHKNQGIGIFEYTERNFVTWTLPLLLTPAFMILSTPFIRPLTLRRVLWTIIIPIVPFIAAWDGFVSCLRTYTPKELERIVESLGASHYRWEIGRIRSFGACYITFLIGCPEQPA
jgi:hypothetical protein